MSTALMIGTSVGAVIGLFHACYVYRQEVGDFPAALADRPVATRAGAGYYALWTFLLWVAFGAYVFFLWLVSVIAYAICKAVQAARTG